MGAAMATTLHDREQAFEAKFARDEAFRFRAVARRDKLFARWAAARLLLSGDATEALVKAVLAIPNRPEHDQVLLRHIEVLMAPGGVGASEQELSAALTACMQQAVRQLIETSPDHAEVI
jgi:hypothetical protein